MAVTEGFVRKKWAGCVSSRPEAGSHELEAWDQKPVVGRWRLVAGGLRG